MVDYSLFRLIFCIFIYILFIFINKSQKIDESYDVIVKNGINFSNIPFRIKIFIKTSTSLCILHQFYSYYIGASEGSELQYYHWLGMVLFISGVLVSEWAILLLGKYFVYGVAVKRDHELIVTGPYRIILHPIYLGKILLLVGTGLVFDSWLVYIPSLLYLIFFGILLGEEETGMEMKLGEKYVKYKSERWKMIPYFF